MLKLLLSALILLLFSGCISKTSINSTANQPLLSGNGSGEVQGDSLAFSDTNPQNTPFIDRGELATPESQSLPEIPFDSSLPFNSPESVQGKLDLMEGQLSLQFLKTFMGGGDQGRVKDSYPLYQKLRNDFQKVDPTLPIPVVLGAGTQIISIEKGVRLNFSPSSLFNWEEEKEGKKSKFSMQVLGFKGYLEIDNHQMVTGQLKSHSTPEWDIELPDGTLEKFRLTGTTLEMNFFQGQMDLLVYFEPTVICEFETGDKRVRCLIKNLPPLVKFNSDGTVENPKWGTIEVETEDFSIPTYWINRIPFIGKEWINCESLRGHFSWTPDQDFNPFTYPGQFLSSFFLRGKELLNLDLIMIIKTQSPFYALQKLERIHLKSESLKTSPGEGQSLLTGNLWAKLFFADGDHRTHSLNFEPGKIQWDGALRALNGSSFVMEKNSIGFLLTSKLPFSDSTQAEVSYNFFREGNSWFRKSSLKMSDSSGAPFMVGDWQGSAGSLGNGVFSLNQGGNKLYTYEIEGMDPQNSKISQWNPGN